MSINAYDFHKKLRHELETYIMTQYFGHIPILQHAVQAHLDEEGLLYQKPYIEASPAYKTAKNGLQRADIPMWMKVFFQKLSQESLGVYPSPFVHQIEALENSVKGKDIFVATGTGSGKTECFMWPLLAKLAGEAYENQVSWHHRGVRVIIMYPMNALVSDQVSRLRKLMGDSEGKFVKIFHEVCGDDVRRPQFGMYTGRTPYPGSKNNLRQDRKLSATLASIANETNNNALYKKLLQEGKIPAKFDVDNFFKNLENGKHITDENDAELLTRFEMQKCTPDILITNYSMLEYMLLRKIEANIWQDTHDWLYEQPENKLLFIIDEAHMYRGSAGGEVALLIRRLFHKLGIQRDKVQFILTTASMPSATKEDQAYVKQFAVDLTAAKDFSSFVYLTGEREDLLHTGNKEIPEEAFKVLDIGHFSDSEANELFQLNAFWHTVDKTITKFSSMADASSWLYKHVLEYRPFSQLIQKCRGNAISLSELADSIFPGHQQDKGVLYVSVLLIIAPLAKNEKGMVLFPARMHMLFRGIHGVYACSNPDCKHSVEHGGLHLGEIFFSDRDLTCPECHSMVYELYNDRRCGALYFHGYILARDIHSSNAYFWRYSGQILDTKDDDKIKEIHLYIPPDKFIPPKSRSQNAIKVCYLDTTSGFINFKDDSWVNRASVRKLYYSTFESKGRPDVMTFSRCPHCERQLSKLQLTSFSTRGSNNSFANLITTQFQLEPSIKGKEDISKYPNEGRKVLLFSDSRQRAAKLAKDMTDASYANAMKKLFMMAIVSMQKEDDISLDDLYGYFCLAQSKEKVNLYWGNEQNKLEEDCEEAKESAEYDEPLEIKTNTAPNNFKKYLLRFYCGFYNTLYDTALSWLEPTPMAKKSILKRLKSKDTSFDEREFQELFNAWVMWCCSEYMSLGKDIGNNLRDTIRTLYHGYGLPADWNFPNRIAEILGHYHTSADLKIYRELFQKVFLSIGDGDRYYINLIKVRPMFDKEHVWYRCEKCSCITPYRLYERCPHCGSDRIHAMEQNEYHAIEFWREPIFKTLNGDKIRVIDTEEDTAQLSHKDQRDKIWSKTEEYELRFQDFLLEGKPPVDILSSTTTMEVGIDIGSLVAIGLRNIPPMRENYQQRAGRAGRRGASLSTIITFCEDGPHDTLYFNNPVPMFRGDPRKPWIDIQSSKLLYRHLGMIIIQSFLEKKGKNLDKIPTYEFLETDSLEFETYLQNVHFKENDILLPRQYQLNEDSLKKTLKKQLLELKVKVQQHPELYGIKDDGTLTNNPKSLLDALYEEGDIPTYSFPKNVISMYTFNTSNKKGFGNQIKDQVERGLDIAISEYAPGRLLVIDKQTYRVGGLYTPYAHFSKQKGSPTRQFLNDPNYLKEIYKCPHCGWFGTTKEEKCPFCGNKDIHRDLPMLKPWGFSPKNGESLNEEQADDTYSSAQMPLYSTLPDAEVMKKVTNCQHMRMAVRENQHIIMLNRGPQDNGFMICKECGAIMPGRDESALKGCSRPYKSYSNVPCSHSNLKQLNLGFEFVTDMLVLEIYLDSNCINTERKNNLWLPRAAQSLAEGLRMAVSRELDIDYTELVTGYRERDNEAGTFVDIYLYDNLSSGAGYAVSMSKDVPHLLKKIRSLLDGCDCESACHKCLKHFRNQRSHSLLDRWAALDLLDWAEQGKVHQQVHFKQQLKLIRPFRNILRGNEIEIVDDSKAEQVYFMKGNQRIKLQIYPGMARVSQQKNTVFVSDVLLKYAKPYALKAMLSQLAKF